MHELTEWSFGYICATNCPTIGVNPSGWTSDEGFTPAANGRFRLYNSDDADSADNGDRVGDDRASSGSGSCDVASNDADDVANHANGGDDDSRPSALTIELLVLSCSS